MGQRGDGVNGSLRDTAPRLSRRGPPCYRAAVTEPGSGSPKSLDPSGGWAAAMGLSIVKLERDEVVIEWTIDDRHRQPYGLVHGSIHCGVVETACSLGAGMNAE